MNAVFADTFYFLALLNPRDPFHPVAVDYSQQYAGPIVTTAWVMSELGDALSDPRGRGAFLRVLRQFRQDPACIFVAPTQEWFDLGVGLYESRPDKEWSLTDCISFVVMKQYGLTDSLTGDHHFEQAGFRAVLARAGHSFVGGVTHGQGIHRCGATYSASRGQASLRRRERLRSARTTPWVWHLGQ